MVFAVNAGNTHIWVGALEDGVVLFSCRLSTNKSLTDIEYAVKLKSILEIYNVDTASVSGAIISSVVPSLTATMVQAMITVFSKKPLVVGPGIKTGLNILLENPGQMGSGIVITAVAAMDKYPLPCITVNLGTTTTFGVLNKDGCYIGGCLCPGLNVSMDVLASATSQLPHVSLEAPKKIIGRSTVECMQSGLIYGFASMLDGMLERLEQELGETPTVVATGDSADRIIAHCKRKGIILDADLALIGLGIIYERNSYGRNASNPRNH